MRAILGAIAAYALLVFIVFSPVMAQSFDGPNHPSPLMPDRQAYDAFYRSFVPASCCFTSTCCYEIKPEDVVDLGNDQYRIVASGQVVTRKGYSPDGAWHRCACDIDYSGPQTTWRIHPQADTRCLFTPSFGS
jgi:hypothetical protein